MKNDDFYIRPTEDKPISLDWYGLAIGILGFIGIAYAIYLNITGNI